MKLAKILVFLVLLLSLSTAASALVDVTIRTNVNNFEIYFVDCLDAGCTTVDTFSGQLLEGTTTNDGSIIVRFPSSLVTPFGYAGYLVANGYLPKAGIYTYNSLGDPRVGRTSIDFTFEKKNACTATVDSFSLENSVYANIPLVIQTDASIAAETQSGFELTGVVGSIPAQFVQNHFSLDTRVTLEIRDVNGDLVESQTQEFTEANNNAIFASSAQPVAFVWTPRIQGPYQAEIITEVIDNQCETTVPASTGKETFEVLPDLPQDMCYTILNNLKVDTPLPVAGQEVEVSFTKITNVATDFGFNETRFELIPMSTAVTYTVTDEHGIVTTQNVEVLPANPDNLNPTEHKFTFQAVEGQNNIQVIGNAPTCIAPVNTQDTIALNLIASAPQVHNVEFFVTSVNGTPVENAQITINGFMLTTEQQGNTTIENLIPGTYAFDVVATGFQPATGSVAVSTFDRVVFITLAADGPVGIEPPLMAALPNITTAEDVNVFQAFNIVDYTIDVDTPTINLQFAIIENSQPNVGVSIDNNGFINVQPTPNFFGASTVTIEVTDTISTANSTFVVNVTSVPDAPIIQAFTQQLFTDPNTPLLFDLTLFDIDVDSAEEDLVWTAVSRNANIVQVSLNNKQLLVTPVALGVTQVALTLTDETGLSDAKDFTINVTNNVPVPACNDGLDNDEDGLIDLNDPGCANYIDNDETDAPVLPACADNLDNDRDGLVDLADPGCFDSNDNDEFNAIPQERTHLKLESISLPNAYDLEPGDTLTGRFRFENDGTTRLDNVRVVLTIQELGIRSTRGRVDMPSGSEDFERVLLDIPDDVVPGYYPLRITIGNGEALRVKYREIFISGAPTEEVIVDYCPEGNKWC